MTASGDPASCLLLSDGAFGSPLHAMRSLRTMGVPVYVATTGTGASILGRSRACTAAADHAGADALAYCRSVIAWIDDLQPAGDVVAIPLSDRLVEYLDTARALFPDRFKLSIPRSEVTNRLVAKHRSLLAAEAAGLNVPAWTDVATEASIDQARQLPLPVAVRPTKREASGRAYFKIEVFRDRQALVDGLRAWLRDGAQLIAQEYIEAPEDAVEFAVLWRRQDRSRTEIVTGRKRRQAGRDGGVMVWGETADLPDVASLSSRFLDASGFTGLGGTEFIRRDGKLWFIEFNPRLEAIHFLATRAGVDTVQLEFADQAGRGAQGAQPARRPASAWIGSAWLQRFLDDPAARRPLLVDRWRFARSPGRVRSVWSWNDPMPGLLLAHRLVTRALSRLAKGVLPGDSDR